MKKFIIMTMSMFLVMSMNLFGASGYTYSDGIFNITNNGELEFKYYSPDTKYGQVTEFGYYFVNDPTNLIALDTKLKGNKSVTIGDLTKGDKIGLYAKTTKNGFETIFSEDYLNPNSDNLFYEVTHEEHENFTFGDTKWFNGRVLGFEGQYKTTGQPLPGLSTTLFVCGFLAGSTLFAGKRKKNN